MALSIEANFSDIVSHQASNLDGETVVKELSASEKVAQLDEEVYLREEDHVEIKRFNYAQKITASSAGIFETVVASEAIRHFVSSEEHNTFFGSALIFVMAAAVPTSIVLWKSLDPAARKRDILENRKENAAQQHISAISNREVVAQSPGEDTMIKLFVRQ